MRRHWQFVALIVLCVASVRASFADPTITSLSPTSGAVGESVTIAGSGFGPTQNGSTVTLHGVTATATNWSDGSILVTVPAGATSGSMMVSVGEVVSSPVSFSVYAGYTSGYQYRRTIVLGHSNVRNTDQTDFPVLVSGVYPYLANTSSGGLLQNLSGYDVIFSSDQEGATKLDHEIDSYDSVTGTVNFWVRIPTLSHTVDTVIYLFYGNPTIVASQENRPGVWRNNYAGVWHFGSGASLNTNDSTANANNGTVNGSPAATGGEISGAMNFSGSSDNLAIRSISLSGTDYTVGAWFKTPLASTGSWNTLTRGTSNDHQVIINESNWHLGAYANQGGGFWDSGFSMTSLSDGWHNLVAAATGYSTTFYIDGSLVGTIPFQSSADIGFLGNYQGGSQQFGIADEIRISTGVARSSDWVATEYTNQSAPSSFYAVESQATPTSAPTIQSISPVEGIVGATVTIQGYGFQATQGASSVTFNGVIATPTSWNDASVVVPVPTGATTGNVIVTVGGAPSNATPFTVYVGYTSGYQYRRTIVLNHAKISNTDQTDFPVLISGVYAYLANTNSGGLVQSPNGYDIIFSTDPEGTNKLDHEIDSYDSATGTASFWVRIPTLSHTLDTGLYVLYGNPNVTTSQENKAGVWRNNYLSVYHLGNGTTVGLGDSSGASYTLSGSATPVSGKIGGGAGFNGNPGTYLYHDSVSAYPAGTSPVTLETWVQLGSSAGGQEIVGYGANSATGSRNALYWDGSNALMELEGIGVSGAMPFDSNWHHLVSVYGGGVLSTTTDQMYLDGVPLSTSTAGGMPSITTTEFKIGGVPTVTFCCALSGSVDEVRVSSGVRRADWVATEYTNESSPSTFYAMGSQDSPNTTATIQFISPPAAAIGASVTIQGAGFQPSQGSSTVAFNGTAAMPTSWNDAAIGLTVPLSATTGNVTVTVGGTASNGASFTVLPSASITSVNPSSGVVGSLVTISGVNFGAAQGASTVSFAGANATPTNWSTTAVTVSVPVGASTGNITITVGGGPSNPVGFTVVPALSITGISPSSGIAGTYITITGTLFGSVQGTSTVALNATNVGISSWSDTKIVAVVPAGASSGPLVVTVNGPSVSSPSFTVTNLPSGWADVDIGNVGQPGSAAYSAGTFTVNGGQGGPGNGGIDGTGDAMNFMYQPMIGDGSIVARLTSLQNGPAGIMIRETLNPGASDVNVVSSYGHIYMQERTSTGANGDTLNGYGASGFPAPVWLKLVRAGNNFTGYASTDGLNWMQLGSTTVSMGQNAYVGLPVSGYSSLATATFDSVSIHSTAVPGPVIASLSSTSASVGSQVGIIGSNLGASQNGSVVLLNGMSAPINSWSDTGISFTVPVGASSGPVLVSIGPGMNDSNPVELEVTGQPLPTTWLNQDVGAVGSQAGSATFSGTTFTVTGGGLWIGGTSDTMQFDYQPLSGDGSIVARLTSLQRGQAGVMIRETLDPSASDATVYSYGSIFMQDRPTTGANVSLMNPYGVSGYPLPVWLQLVRSGSTLTGYVSSDGVGWSQLGSTTISMSQNVYIGLVVCGDSALGTATFDSVSINSTAVQAPVITGLSATTAAIGSQVEINGSGFGADQVGSIASLNGAPMTVNLWSNTLIVFTIAPAATSGPVVVSVAPTMNASNPIRLQITMQPLSTPWLNQDVGLVSQTGSASYSSGTFTIAGSGAGFGGTADAMQFVYQLLSGDGSIIARGTGEQGGEAGLMIRETLNPGAADAFLAFANSAILEYRTATGASSNSQVLSFGASSPYWLELVRSGNTFTGFISNDGVSWTQIGSTTIAMAQTVDIGLAISGYGGLATATFDSVTADIGTTPFVSSVNPIIGTFGTPVTITGSNFGTSQGSSTIQFDGAAATSITSWSNSQIVAVVPNSALSGTGPVTVTVSAIPSPGNPNSLFTVLDPVITSIEPPSGPAGGTLTLNGSGFGASQNGVVLVNGANAPVAGTCLQNPWYACWSDTQIQVIIPNTSSGLVTVSNNGIVSNSIPFTVTPPPVITSLSPSTGEPTTVITIGGSNFGATQSDSSVAVTGISAVVSSWSDSSIVASVPKIAMNGNVTVTVAGITALGPLFIFNAINQLTASNGAVTTYDSGDYGNAWRLYSSAGPGCSTCSVRGNVLNSYDDNGNLISTTDANGNTGTYTYDGNNNMASQTAQLNGSPVTTSYTYNNFAEVLTMTDPLGNTTTNTYDAKGNLLTVVSPPPDSQTSPSVTQFAYNTLGELTQILDPLNHPTTISYYPTGLIQSITDAQNNTTSYNYDSRGNRTGVIDPINGAVHPTTFAYDAMSRLTGITYPDGTAAGFGYDTRGRRTSATDQNNKTTLYAYDDADRLISVTDAAGNLTQYGYDTESNLTSIIDADTHTIFFAYDTMGRVIQTTFPSTLTETYGYDQLYNLTSKTDRKNQTIQYVYDSLYRMTSKTYPDETSANYVYDLVGKIQQVTDSTGTYGFAYDNLGRLVGTSTQYAFLPGHNFQNGYGYDKTSNRTSLTAPDGSTNAYQYDTLNRLTTLTNSLTGQFGFGYDALSRRTQLTRPNGVNTNYNYDSVSHLLSVLHQAGSTTLDGASYAYDYAGNRTSKTNYLSGVTSNYAYDPIYELQQVTQGGSTTEIYSYDAVGNRLSSSGVPTYSYNPSNELTSNSSGSYTYDANGNTLSDPSGKSYSWDFENRLTQAVNPGVGTTTFRYDPFGRRIQKSGPLGNTNYLYDGPRLLEEVDNGGNVLVRYTQSRGIDEPLAQLRSTTTSYYQQDGLGSVTSLSNTAGTVANTYTYDSFGKLTASTGTLVNPFQYTGRESEAETGIYQNRFRYYDQSAGRFISEDPVGFLGGINKYVYVLNRPTSFNDPFGLQGGCPEYPTDCVHSPDERAQMQREHGEMMRRILGPDSEPNPSPAPPSNCDHPKSPKGDCTAAWGETGIGIAATVGEVALIWYLAPVFAEEGIEGVADWTHIGPALAPGPLLYLHGIMDITEQCQ